MEIVGYVLAVAMGITLGLLGGGGSILTVPILVYVLGIEPVLATGYSLFIVGATSIFGTVKKHFENFVAWKEGLIFAIPSLIAVFLTRYKLVPAIPENIITFGYFTLTKNMALMLFFALVMLIASYTLIKERKENSNIIKKKLNIPLIAIEGLVVGVISGLVGAGGGFLIVPALVLFVGLPMKKAVGTSLLIISIKSLIGFLGDIGSGQSIDWSFLLLFTAFSIMGIFIGTYINKFVSQVALKKIFGYFIAIMAIFILTKELFLS